MEICYCWRAPGAPLKYFNDGGSERGSYFIPKKLPTSKFVYPKKSLLFLAYPKKSLSVFASANFIIIFWKAKTCQLQLWFWSKTKL